MTTTETVLARVSRLVRTDGTATLELAPNLTVTLRVDQVPDGAVLAAELLIRSPGATTRVHPTPVPFPGSAAGSQDVVAALSSLSSELHKLPLLLGESAGVLERLGYEDRHGVAAKDPAPHGG